MEIVIPGRGTYDITHVVLDMNGTLALDGQVLEGVAERLASLGDVANVAVITADTHGGASRLRDDLALQVAVIDKGDEAEQKVEFLRRLGAEHAVAIGNGANDALMLAESAVGICVLGGEGASLSALQAADVVVADIRDALDLLLKPPRLVATLRG